MLLKKKLLYILLLLLLFYTNICKLVRMWKTKMLSNQSGLPYYYNLAKIIMRFSINTKIYYIMGAAMFIMYEYWGPLNCSSVTEFCYLTLIRKENYYVWDDVMCAFRCSSFFLAGICTLCIECTIYNFAVRHFKQNQFRFASQLKSLNPKMGKEHFQVERKFCSFSFKYFLNNSHSVRHIKCGQRFFLSNILQFDLMYGDTEYCVIVCV